MVAEAWTPAETVDQHRTGTESTAAHPSSAMRSDHQILPKSNGRRR